MSYLVVGSGLIGTSVGLALGRDGAEVFVEDADPVHAQAAESLGAGSTAAPGGIAVVVVAVPPQHLGGAVVQALERFPEATVTDVGSVKGPPLEAARSHGVDLSRYVGSHPMAGSERSGPWAATADLFDGRAWAVTPHEDSSPQAVQAVRQLAERCGASVVEMPAHEHDAAVARVSHLPHLLSVLAAGTLVDAPPQHLALSGPGLRDVTRIAAGDPALWQEIVTANAEPIRALLQDVRDRLDELMRGVDDGSVTDVLQRGVEGTRLVPGKHGAPAPAYSVVYVAIPDRPGALARLFSDAGESGVNIEDLRIDHDPARPVGLVEVVVAEQAAATLVRALSERGWSANQ
uniref:Prephenate dehydrogenase n=1 Tax=uncultured Nocardioidaceae bacterium TaxID=253824 RepID=A0A6J4LWR5_9ACTN|nr:MAG: Arogenate dehydrogenase [uncultured Nocardioidaceae bacterium]